MPVAFEFKLKGKPIQYQAIDQAIRAGQFVRNKCIRLWMDVKGTNKYDLSAYCRILAKEYPFAQKLNSTARQAMAERAWASIHRFYENCKKKVPGKKGYPKFKKFSRSVEYKQSGWKLSDQRKKITFTDKIGIGTLKLKGTWDLHFYQIKQIKRVRLIRRADGYYVQFLINTDITGRIEPTGKTIGLDVGLKEFYTDSNGDTVENPRFYRQGEKRMKFYQRRVSRKNKGSSNRKKAINKLGRVHLNISRQRQEHAKRVARCVVQSNDLVAYEDLRVKNLVKNHTHPSSSPPGRGWGWVMMQVGISSENGWSILALNSVGSQLLLIQHIRVKIALIVELRSKSHYRLGLMFVSVDVS